MAQEILMPKLGLTMTEGTIEEWKVKEGDTVKKGDVLFSVATEKLVNDVEAENDGVLLKILLPEGETAPCKAIVGYLGENGEQVAESDNIVSPNTAESSLNTKVLASPLARKFAKSKGIELEKIAGTGPRGRITLDDVKAYTAAKPIDGQMQDLVANVSSTVGQLSDILATVSAKEMPDLSSVKTSPLAVKLAKELDRDMQTVKTMERVMKTDLLAAGNVRDNNLPPQRVSTLRRSIAANMTKSWQTSPCVTYTRSVECTAMKNLRELLKKNLKDNEIILSYNHILMKVVAKVLLEFPDVNSSFADDMLIRHEHANVGLAVARGDGLLVPNVKCCEEKSLTEIAKETENLIEEIHSGKITPENLTGGTFTVSNLGTYGITSFSPIINQPELAILGVCAMVDTPVVRQKHVVIRTMMNLSLTADHRVVDGVMAAKFLKRVCEILENPSILLV
ncbi:MAG: 2-oxo acid dehydrogenase subunit E2 [Acidaminococcaceae bacterium]|jgi:pyruvate dehydrogenase E2 component (dihydrolipoamide acetyltransferase)|nr:2-oxo acid dehydrogenase subunit E2 [Acidaminococcaceae bacterium]